MKLHKNVFDTDLSDAEDRQGTVYKEIDFSTDNGDGFGGYSFNIMDFNKDGFTEAKQLAGKSHKDDRVQHSLSYSCGTEKKYKPLETQIKEDIEAYKPAVAFATNNSIKVFKNINKQSYKGSLVLDGNNHKVIKGAMSLSNKDISTTSKVKIRTKRK